MITEERRYPEEYNDIASIGAASVEDLMIACVAFTNGIVMPRMKEQMVYPSDVELTTETIKSNGRQKQLAIARHVFMLLAIDVFGLTTRQAAGYVGRDRVATRHAAKAMAKMEEDHPWLKIAIERLYEALDLRTVKQRVILNGLKEQ